MTEYGHSQLKLTIPEVRGGEVLPEKGTVVVLPQEKGREARKTKQVFMEESVT